MALGIVVLTSIEFLRVWNSTPHPEWLWEQRRLAKVRYDVSSERVIAPVEVVAPFYTELDNLPDFLTDALVLREDRRFFSHEGISPRSVGRAISRNFRNMLPGQSRNTEGASTISMQTARLLLLENKHGLVGRLRRKFSESVLALKLEHSLSKEQILDLYVNHVPLGNGVHGVGAASRFYFGKDVRELSALEAAILVTSIPSPNSYNYKTAPALAVARAQRFLTTHVVDAGFLGQHEARNAARARVRKGHRSLNRPETRFLWDYVRPQLQHLTVKPGRYIAFLTLDPEAQVYADRAIHRGVPDRAEAALVAIAPDGAIQAMVGSRGYKYRSFNQAIVADRQPASTFKLFVYVAALRTHYRLGDTIIDAPFENDWPKNSDGKYLDRILFEDGLIHSRNAATVWLLKDVGFDALRSTLQDMGVGIQMKEELGIALGQQEVSLLDMTMAYTVIANGGNRVQAHGLNMIVDGSGNILFRAPGSVGPRVLTAPEVQAVDEILVRAVGEGTGRGAAIPGLRIGGKTGTSSENRDALFVGYSRDVCVGVWVGRPDRKPMPGLTGSGAPLDIWTDFMTAADHYIYLAKRNVTNGESNLAPERDCSLCFPLTD